MTYSQNLKTNLRSKTCFYSNDTIFLDTLSIIPTAFKIKDTGIGIKPENKEKILEAFLQEDSSTTRKFGGTGLGLSITKSLLKMMKSKLDLESNEQKGSTFSFNLVLKSEVCKKHFLTNNNTIKKALIIENNKTVANVIKQMFTQFDIDVDILNSTENINEVITQKEITNLFLLDYAFLSENTLDKIIEAAKINTEKAYIIMQNCVNKICTLLILHHLFE